MSSSRKHSNKEKAVYDVENAVVLSKFANLDAADVGKVRNDYPDFAPPQWWTYQSDNEFETRKQWEITQENIRRAWTDWETAWNNNCDADVVETMKLLMMVFNPDDFVLRIHRPMFATFTEIDGQSGYHKAVAFMAKQPWRAKVCEECHRRFVADHSKRLYCSLGAPAAPACSAVVIERTHLEWGRANNWGRPIPKAKKRKK